MFQLATPWANIWFGVTILAMLGAVLLMALKERLWPTFLVAGVVGAAIMWSRFKPLFEEFVELESAYIVIIALWLIGTAFVGITKKL